MIPAIPVINSIIKTVKALAVPRCSSKALGCVVKSQSSSLSFGIAVPTGQYSPAEQSLHCVTAFISVKVLFYKECTERYTLQHTHYLQFLPHRQYILLHLNLDYNILAHTSCNFPVISSAAVKARISDLIEVRSTDI